MISIGERVRAKRKEHKLTMKQLHDETGLSTGNISDIENGKFSPSIASLIPLSHALHCSIDWLVTGEEYTKETRLSEHIEPRFQIYCDGVPLTEDEADLIAMYRLIEAGDRKTIFDLTKLKYQQSTGEKISTYSMYTETNERQKIEENAPDGDKKTSSGIA